MPKIERAGLDGSDRRVVAAEGVKSPSGLAVNPSAGELFWCDSDLGTVESVKYDGTRRRVLLRAESRMVQRPMGIVYFQGNVYWLDASFAGGSISRYKSHYALTCAE